MARRHVKMVYASPFLLVVVDSQASCALNAVCRLFCCCNMGVLPMVMKRCAPPDSHLRGFVKPNPKITIVIAAMLTACGATNPAVSTGKNTMQDAWALCWHCDLQSNACNSCISANMQ